MIGILSTTASTPIAVVPRASATLAAPTVSGDVAAPPSAIVTLSGASQPSPPATYAPRAATPTGAVPGNWIQRDATFTVKTTSGATATFRLASTADGLALVEQDSGKLSDAERTALATLSGAFQDAIEGMAAVPPKLDVQGLMAFDPSVLASVDFQGSTVAGNSAPQTIAFHADGVSRSLKTTGAIGTIDVSVDMSSPGILGNASQRAAAIDTYLQQFDKAASRGQANPSLMAMFKDAFTQLNSSTDTAASTLLKTPRISLSASDHATLTGLADFHASITQATSAANPLRPDEKDGFSYQVSQETRISGRDSLNRGISQHLQSTLSASFHRALSPGVSLMLTDDPKSQNYYYTQIDDSADSQTDIAYQKGRLTSASVTQSASQSTHQSKYVMGKLVEDTTMPYSQSRTRDLLALLKPLEDDGTAPTRQRQAEREQALSAIHAGVGLESDPVQLGSRPATR